MSSQRSMRYFGRYVPLVLSASVIACSSDDLADILDLPGPQDSFSDRLIVLGSSNSAEGPKVYLQGVDASGNALSSAQLAELEIWVNGELVHGCEEGATPGDGNSTGGGGARCGNRC